MKSKGDNFVRKPSLKYQNWDLQQQDALSLSEKTTICYSELNWTVKAT